MARGTAHRDIGRKQGRRSLASRKAAALARTRETMRAALLSSGARRTFAIAVFIQVILAAIFEELRNQVAWLIVVGLISVLAAFGRGAILEYVAKNGESEDKQARRRRKA